MKIVTWTISHFVLWALASAVLGESVSLAEPTIYLRCGHEGTSRRLVVIKDGSYGSVRVFKKGEIDPTVNATAAFTFSRCGQGVSCPQSPQAIKTLGSFPSYNLSLPWRAMESGDKFHVTLNEHTKGHLGEPVVKSFSLTCQPGGQESADEQELVASVRVSK